jgi:hypothetical protein
MNPDTRKYNAAQAPAEQKICDVLAREIDQGLPEAENKVWHAHPVWFLDGNPVVGYSKLKDAEVRYTVAAQVNREDMRRWLRKARDIQWDYKNIVRRNGRLERLK